MAMLHYHQPEETNSVRKTEEDSPCDLSTVQETTTTNQSEEVTTTVISPSDETTQNSAWYKAMLNEILNTLEKNLSWIFLSFVMAGFYLFSDYHKGRRLTGSLIFGEILFCLTMFGFIMLGVNFKGRTVRAWLISWLMRFTLMFCSLWISGVAKFHQGFWFLDIIGASIAATLSCAWYYSRQSRAKR